MRFVQWSTSNGVVEINLDNVEAIKPNEDFDECVVTFISGKRITTTEAWPQIIADICKP